MSELRECPSCGTPLPKDAPGGLCPQCLLESATIASSGGAGGTATITGTKRPVPGSTFGGYKIFRPLGKGGMGEVWEAEQIESGRRVALKVLGQALDSTESRGRFLREGRLAASVNHPNSVYVFGTEEIDGTPVIAMELIPGGTLHDRIREHGPMPVAGAVDAILQIIAGLEAAQSIGILHRDVKPSNCFVEPDGSVKIGDFGLSISTAGRADANITVAGSVLGTPAFSSPEQLRGDELSVRSDIYSVGVTLYYLLTGRTPFEAENFVKLLSRVIEEQPASPATHRKEIPQGLARIVIRCLAKQPGERFRDYAELRRALFSHSSTAPTPAMLGLRFVAAAIDTFLVGFACMFFSVLMMNEAVSVMHARAFQDTRTFAVMLGAYAISLTYYAVMEGRWGATLGKAVCRLRVQQDNRQLPGVPRAFLRVLVYTFIPQFPLWYFYATMAGDPDAVAPNWSAFLPYTYYVGLLLLFATARRGNGFAALQDLASRTRVVSRTDYQERPRLIAAAEPEPPATGGGAKIGPYHVLGKIGTADETLWRLAYDTKLLRKVWVHLRPANAPAVATPLRSLNRVGRLRWLNARRPEVGSEGSAWDAYEGLDGQALTELLRQPQPWRAVRFWLMDLAEELAQSEKDGTTPMKLALDRVWITESGRAKLLDFPAPGLGDGNSSEGGVAQAGSNPPPLQTGGPGGTSRFLHEVAVAALVGGGKFSGESLPAFAANPQPMAVRKFIEVLPGMKSAAKAVTALKPLMHGVAAVTRARRAAMVAGCLAAPLVTVLAMQLGVVLMKQWRAQAPEVMEINHLLQIRTGERIAAKLSGKVNNEDLVGIYLARHYSNAITNPDVWNSPTARMLITGDRRHYAEESVTKFAAATDEEIAAAEKRLKRQVEAVRSNEFMTSGRGIIRSAFVGLIVFVALPALIAALLFRGGLVMRAAGVMLVNQRGEPAPRWRVFWRSLIIWVPVLALAVSYQVLHRNERDIVVAITAVVLGVIVGWSTQMPERGIPDRLSGTWPVPR